MIKRGLKVGDVVAWTSQARGWRTVKIGRVIEIIPAGTRMYERLLYATHGYSGIPPHAPRNHESYLIAVPAPANSQARSRVYWPHAKSLWLLLPVGNNG